MRDAFDRLDTGCAETMELVDAYALGALENQEAAALQQHLSDCAPCREELSKSQRTAALLSLSVRIEQAPSSLRARIFAMAETEKYDLPAWRRFFPFHWASSLPQAVRGGAEPSVPAMLQD